MTKPSKPKFLLIETSGAIGRAGLGLADALVGEATLDHGRQHTRDLIPQCQRLCEQQVWKPADLDAIVVSAGPGSYTGLRVGMMTAKTLAYALNKPLVSIPTFEVISKQCFLDQPQLTALHVIADGQQDRVYVQQFGTHAAKLTGLSILKGADWRASLAAGANIAGPGLRQQQAQLPGSMNLLPEPLWDPQLSALLQLGVAHFDKGYFADSFSLEPLYLRASSAEEQWAALGK